VLRFYHLIRENLCFSSYSRRRLRAQRTIKNSPAVSKVRMIQETWARFAVVAERRRTADSSYPTRCCLVPPLAYTPSSSHSRCRRPPTTSHAASSPRPHHHACTLHASAGWIPPCLVSPETDTTRQHCGAYHVPRPTDRGTRHPCPNACHHSMLL